jgi:hypothetical protein
LALTLLAGGLPPALARSPEQRIIADLLIAPTSLPQTPSNASELVNQGFTC